MMTSDDKFADDPCDPHRNRPRPPTERLKSDRARMADAVIAIAKEFGCAVEIEREGENPIAPKRTQVTVHAARGLTCHFDFDGETCQPDVFVNPWHIAPRSDARLSDCFPGKVNSHHFQKSTTVSHGFAALCDHICLVLEMARDGRAFDHQRAMIAAREIQPRA